MPLTITINEAAPGTLTIGVGTPGVGVPAGGTAGQVLTKVDSTDYNTVFATPSADYITAVTAPLSVTSGNLSVNLSTYLPLAGGTMDANATVELSDTVTGTVSEVGGYGFAVSSSSNINLKTNVLFDRVLVAGAVSATTIKPTGVEFPDLTLQTSAGISAATAAATYQTLAGMSSYLTTSTAASTYQTLAGMSSYLTTATAATTYAPIAAGLPTGGTVGQVLTKNSGTNFDASFATLIPGDRYLTTSTTSLSISNANKTLTVGTGLSYTPTQNVTIAYDASNHMHGEVLTYNSGTGVLTVDVNNHTGTGTYAAWTVNVGGVTPATSVAWGAITGTLSAQTDLQNALDLKLDVSTAASTYYLQTNPSGFIGDAPSDGSTYGRNNGAWAVAGGGYITSVTSPLSVTSNDLSVDLSAYLPLAGGTMAGYLYSNIGNGMDSVMTEGNFKVKNTSTPTDYGELTAIALRIQNSVGGMVVGPDMITFPDASTQATAGYPASGNPSGFLTDAPSDGNYYSRYNGAWSVPSFGVPEAPNDGLLYARNNLNWTAFTAGVSAPPYYNSVWAYGNWYSANVTNIFDTGTMMYYNVLTF